MALLCVMIVKLTSRQRLIKEASSFGCLLSSTNFRDFNGFLLNHCQPTHLTVLQKACICFPASGTTVQTTVSMAATVNRLNKKVSLFSMVTEEFIMTTNSQHFELSMKQFRRYGHLHRSLPYLTRGTNIQVSFLLTENSVQWSIWAKDADWESKLYTKVAKKCCYKEQLHLLSVFQWFTVCKYPSKLCQEM